MKICQRTDCILCFNAAHVNKGQPPHNVHGPASNSTPATAQGETAPLKFSGPQVRRSVEDLRELLSDGTTPERKSRIRGWLSRIEVDTKRGGTVYYKMPPWIQKAMGRPTAGGPTRSVLSIDQIGCPSPTLFKTGMAFYSSFPSAN